VVSLDQAKAERDRRLQAEIRHLQVETVKLERGWRAAANEEKASIMAARDKEEKQMQVCNLRNIGLACGL
jgi:hypothetical protein